MKQEILNKISEQEEKLNELDAEGHIWWHKFRQFIEEIEEERMFTLTKEQEEKYEAWKKTLPKLSQGHFGAVGGGYSFEFTPTGIGTIVVAKRADDPKHEIDLTEYEYF
jgi:hypothetical protein